MPASGGQWNAMGSGLSRSSSQIVNGVTTHNGEAWFVGVFARGWTSPNSQPNFARWSPTLLSDDYVIGMPWVDCTLDLEPNPLDSGELLLTHGSNAGQSYVVEASVDGENWTSISDPFAAGDNGVIWTIPAGVPDRIFRIEGSNP